MDESAVFVFVLRGQKRHLDPFAALDQLHLACAEIKRDFDELCRQSDQRKEDGPLDILASYEPRQLLEGVAREVFELPAIDPATGEGFTSREVNRILDEFLFFCQSEKKNAAS